MTEPSDEVLTKPLHEQFVEHNTTAHNLGEWCAAHAAEIERALEWCARPSKLLERIAELEVERDEWRERATACVRDDLFVRILAALKGE